MSGAHAASDTSDISITIPLFKAHFTCAINTWNIYSDMASRQKLTAALANSELYRFAVILQDILNKCVRKMKHGATAVVSTVDSSQDGELSNPTIDEACVKKFTTDLSAALTTYQNTNNKDALFEQLWTMTEAQRLGLIDMLNNGCKLRASPAMPGLSPVLAPIPRRHPSTLDGSPFTPLYQSSGPVSRPASSMRHSSASSDSDVRVDNSALESASAYMGPVTRNRARSMSIESDAQHVRSRSFDMAVAQPLEEDASVRRGKPSRRL